MSKTPPPSSPPTKPPRRVVVTAPPIKLTRKLLMEAVEMVAMTMKQKPNGAPIVPGRAWLVIGGVCRA